MALPTLESLFLETPLYEKFTIDYNSSEYLYQVLYFNNKLDAFCPFCDRQSTFRGTQKNPITPSGYGTNKFADFAKYGQQVYEGWTSHKIHHVNLVCTRVESHLMLFSFYLTPDSLTKIGQFPSIADLSMPDLRKYREVLSAEKYRELNRGVGLITHGVGIGAFTYLRRIFEDLIEEAHKKLAAIEGWDEGVYQRSRMDEKIDLLKAELPAFLVENRKLYAILSKGIHELSENDCLEYFPTVKLGVELILDEKLEAKRRQDKIELAKKSIGKIHGDIASGSG